jgi:hypothetical protein
MPNLGQELDRLANRGPTADPNIVLQRAERAATDLGSERTDALGGRRPSWRVRLAVGTVGLACVASVAWLGAQRSPVESPSAGSSGPAAPETVGNAAQANGDLPSTTSTPIVTTPELSAADATLLADLYALLNVPTRDEMITFLSFNVPEADVARCMEHAGFQYIEGPSPEEEVASDLRFTMTPGEYAASFGFGVAAPDLGLIPGVVDPNFNYLTSLPTEDQEEFQRWSFSCSGREDAWRRAWSSAINSAVATFSEQLDADQRVASARTTWSQCMADQGYVYDSQRALMESLYARLGPLSSARFNGEDVDDELSALMNDEIAIAVANVPCRAAYEQTYRAVVFERFAEFRVLFDAAMGDQPTSETR